jgi:hypothetical protein
MARSGSEARLAKLPNGQVLGTLASGSQVATGRTDGESIEVTLDGWVISSSLGQTNRDGFNLVITQTPAENIRQAPNGAILARLSTGVLLNKVEEQRGWTHVRRTAWAPRRAFSTLPASPVPSPAVSSSGPLPMDHALVAHSTPLSVTAGGPGVGALDSGAVVRVLARSGDYARVALEGWVKESDLQTATEGVLVGVTQAEVRAEPSRFLGKVVEWRVQFIAIQTADALRPELPNGQSYLLTRGPLPEPGFVYVIVKPDQLESFRAVASLQELVIRATIKAPTSKYLPTPVVELIGVVSGMGQ